MVSIAFFAWKRDDSDKAHNILQSPDSFHFADVHRSLFTSSSFPCHCFAESHDHSFKHVEPSENLLSMESLRHSLTLLVTLSISLSTSIAHPRHGGRTHKHKHAPRQGGFAGIQILSSPGGPNPSDLPPSDAIAPASVSMAAFIPAPTTDLPENSIGISISNNMTRTFPITVLQIPVATICPPNASIPHPTPYVAPSINITTSVNGTKGGGPILNTTSSSTNATDYLPPTAKVSIYSPSVSLADHNARVILGDNGCQTLFSPTTTAICSTVVSVGGQVPVSVTDCGQRVTFSSSPICGPVATAAPNGTGGETMAYFLGPWYDIAAGAVPVEVEVRMCSSAGLGASSSCMTTSESWSVSTTMAQSTVLQTVRFFGGAIGVSQTSSLYSPQI